MYKIKVNGKVQHQGLATEDEGYNMFTKYTQDINLRKYYDVRLLELVNQFDKLIMKRSYNEAYIEEG